MASDVTTIATGNGRGRVRLLTRGNLDGRTKARRQFDSIAEGIAEDLGGEDRLSTVQRTLIEAFAGAAVHVHDLNARLLLGQEVDITAHASAISTMVRIASRIGMGRVARDVSPPSVQEYLEHKRTQPRGCAVTKSVPYASATTGIKAREEIRKVLRRFGCEEIGFSDELREA